MRKHLPRTQSWTRLVAAVAAAWLAGPLTSLHAALPTVVTKDKVAAREGILVGGSRFTLDGGGYTGQAGDYAIDFGMGTGPVHVTDGSFLNTATAANEMSFALWIKKYDNSASSAFWAFSPSSSGTQRGWQAHIPWSNEQIYFDTAGCCDGATQRINAHINTFWLYTGDITWWTTQWHLFVFSKKGDTKRIWIDGELFLEGINTGVLPTDITQLFIGAQGVGTSLMRGLIDDFAVFGTELSQATIQQIFSGTKPTALPASAKLMAYWDFNDVPAGGQFVSLSPAPNAATAAPNLVRVVHINGSIAWDLNNVGLKLDGVAVTPTLTRVDQTVTLSYVPSPLLAPQSKHMATLTYPGAAGPQTVEWEFTVGPYTQDRVASRVGVFTGGSGYTGAGGGRTGQSGDYAVDFGMGTGPVHVGDGTFLNQATAKDEMTFALWVKKADIASSSAFWARSPSSSGGGRGWQAHIPTSDGRIYFDTAGCCDAGTQRIFYNIIDFPPYTGDLTWWTSQWHLFVFTKKADVKRIWIDGLLFYEGYNTGILPTDMTELFIGAESLTAGLYHGLIDDFAVFSTALSETSIVALYNGTAPTTLPATDQLLAYWDFNDIPPGGLFLSFTPAPDTTSGVPNLVRVVHLQGTEPWDLDKVSLKIDGAAVTASATRDASRVTVNHVPSPIFAPLSKHTATLTYPLPGGALADRSWSFTVGNYSKDLLNQRIGLLMGPSVYTADGGGRSGQPGDYGIDLGRNNARQGVRVLDASFLNAATANNELALAAWQKLYQVADSSLFWVTSPTTGSGGRAFQGHTPWSNSQLYFDTGGCCDAATQRINAHINTFPRYSGAASWWQTWHHIVFQKQGDLKQIWIDGELFLEGFSSNLLPTDITEMWFGYNPADNGGLRGIIDDAAAFKTALSPANIASLAAGTMPNALPASAGLMAYWSFNDPTVVVGPKLMAVRSGNNVTVTSDPQPMAAGFVLQTAPAVTGPWTTQAGANTPLTVPIGTEQAVFLRAVKP
ncbi:MAG: LamG domain-containing protein [Verrucomicrobia bacterium]|nr:LamG domain-containing protein [Verrucomicrobiota bacterium]